MKKITVIQNLGNDYEQETIFMSDCFPMAIHHAEVFAKRNGLKLIRSPKKIRELFHSGYRVACSSNEKIFYAI